MSAAEEFFRSLREVFARNRDADWATIGLTLAAALSVGVGTSIWASRRRAHRAVERQIRAIAAGAGLSRDDLDLFSDIAREAKLPVPDVLTSRAGFERATAAALAAQPPTLRPPPGSLFARVHRVRRALGFLGLPPHQHLVSTRELVTGDLIAFADITAAVTEIDEATFAVDLPPPHTPAAGDVVAVGIVRPDDSRYIARVQVFATEPAAGGLQRVFFTHDEHPERQQHRQHVRVRVHGPVSIRFEQAESRRSIEGRRRLAGRDSDSPRDRDSLSDNGSPDGDRRSSAPTSRDDETSNLDPLTGTLTDVSAGGLALDLPAHRGREIRPGALVRCSFELGEDARFASMRAVVTAVESGASPLAQHLRLAFTDVNPGEQDRLAAALVRKQQRATP